MHEGGLDQPLEVLVGRDGIEAWYKLTAASHCKLLLLLCGGSVGVSQGVCPRDAAWVVRVASSLTSLTPKVSIHPFYLTKMKIGASWSYKDFGFYETTLILVCQFKLWVNPPYCGKSVESKRVSLQGGTRKEMSPRFFSNRLKTSENEF